jgi:Peptidase C10 family/Spi protease inhibitor
MIMRKLILPLLVICLAIMITVTSAQAQMATRDEALTVASNWITTIIQKKGDWGGSETAEIVETQEFRRGERVLGYFFRVHPKGYIIVPLRKEMAPVKAYSARSDLDPESEEGMADFLKEKMERILDKTEQVVASEKAGGAEKLTDILEIDYRPAWKNLEGGVTTTQEELQSNEGFIEGGNYQEGQWLLTSNWHLTMPYNDDCPFDSCPQRPNGRTVVGCTAVAGAQIMRYWNWPPYGVGSPYSDPYDWPNMIDNCLWFNGQWTDNNGIPITVTQAQIDAVAELSFEVGDAVDTTYTCTASDATMEDMVGVYEFDFRYVPSVRRTNRSGYSAVGWFDLLKYEFNHNRPVQYRIVKKTTGTGHSIVGDGWQETGSNPILRQYHMNYGESPMGNDTWYTLDAMSNYPENEEYVIRTIYPYPSAYEGMQGTFPRQSFPYRYFPIDLSLTNTTVFQGGQRLQFLPNIVLGYSGSSGSIRIEGSSSYDSHLFTRGDLTRGVRIYKNSSAVINLNQNGSLKFY